MRIVFARAIDNIRTALVMESLDGTYRAGVVIIARYEEDICRRNIVGQDRIFGYVEHEEMRLWLVWEWYEIVTSPDEFMATRGWERAPSQRQIEKPVPRITHEPPTHPTQSQEGLADAAKHRQG